MKMPKSNNTTSIGDDMWEKICNKDEISDNSVLAKDIAGRQLMVCRISDTISVTDRICTHEDADLSCGFVSPDGVRCPLHLSVFDVNTGEPLNPPAVEPLSIFNVKIEYGEVYVEV